jgi:hypothetical protein
MIRHYYVQIPPHLSELLADLGGVSTDAEFDVIISAGRPQLFNFTYPIPTADKESFENWFCNHYIMRRIGSGNIKKWRQMFKAKLLDIMPYYNDLMASTHLEYDPLINQDLGTTETGASTSDTTRDRTYSETGSSVDINRYSDTPQGDSSRIWEVDAQGHPVLTDIYLTDIRGITDEYKRAGTEHEVTDNDQTRRSSGTRQGISGVGRAQLMKEYRETFLRIYQMIAEELDEVFYNLVEIDDILDYPPDSK